MKNIIKKAQAQFREIQVLLSFPDGSKSDYFTKLSIGTEEAYFTMNSGMCSNTAVCKNCLKHRDFIRSLMDILGELEVNSTASDKYSTILIGIFGAGKCHFRAYIHHHVITGYITSKVRSSPLKKGLMKRYRSLRAGVDKLLYHGIS